MHHSLESLAVRVASGVPRRNVLRSMLGVLAAGGFGTLLTKGGSVAAASQAVPPSSVAPGSVRVRAFTLKMRVPTGECAQLHLPDRWAARFSYRNEKLILVPHILADTNQVELSIYKQSGNELLRRLMLPLVTNGVWHEVPVVDAGLSSMRGLAFAALWPRDVYLPPSYSAEDDCCTQCCFGGQACAPAVCCDKDNPNCGNCCDGGSCPGCSGG